MENKRFINPISDFGYKRIFGDEEIMKAFLNDIIRPNSPIVEVAFIDKESNDIHRINCNLLCKTEDKSELIVEMQRHCQDIFVDNFIFELFENFSMQDTPYDLKPVYGILLLDSHVKGLSEQRIRTIKPKIDETNEILSDKLVVFTLELPNYRKMKSEECKDRIDYWLYNLANMEMMDGELCFEKEQPIFKRVGMLANIRNLTAEELKQYRIIEKPHTSQD